MAAEDLPVFMEPWYLDAVCSADAWDAIVIEKSGKIVAVWPFYIKNKGPWRYVSMPLLGRFMGPHLAPEWRSVQREIPILESLLAQMPPLAAFEQDFNYTATNWLPLYWQGFRQTTRYSYRLRLDDPESLWDKLSADYRNQKIPKARVATQVYAGSGVAEFLRVHDLSFIRQGKKPPIALSYLKKLDGALADKNRRVILSASDQSSAQVMAVAYMIWDRQSAYYLMAGEDPNFRQKGAGIFLAWEAIQYAATVLKVPWFDFAGSMIKPIERVRRQFGAEQVPYFRVAKEWSWLWKTGKQLFR